MAAWKPKTLPTSHRPDLQFFRRVELNIDDVNAPGKNDAYMWPHINLEDLSTRSTMLRLLNSRGRNAPSAFAAMDWDSTELGRSAWVITKRRLNGAWWMNLEADNVDTYGAINSVPQGSRPNATKGLVILKIQDDLMCFLVEVCRGILHDKNLDQESLEQISEEPKPPSLATTKEGDWPSAVDLALESPYLAPQTLDLGRVQSLFQARLREWEDYAWAMREDPFFFADVVGDWNEHSSDQNLRPNRKPKAALSDPEQNKMFWDRSIVSAINECYENLIVWNIVSQHLTSIMAYQKEQLKGAHSRTDNVPDYVPVVRRLKVLLDKRVIEKLQRELAFILPSSPPMRSMFESDPKRGKLQLRSELPKNDYLRWLGNELWEMRDVVPSDLLAMELNRLVQQDKTQKERVTPMVARHIADLGIAYELRSQLRMLCPQLFDPETQDAQAEMADTESWSTDLGIRALYDLKKIIAPVHSGQKFLRLGDLGGPKKLPYPVNKNRTKENVATMQRTEHQLDELWDTYDEHLKKHLNTQTNALLQGAVPTGGAMQRTPDWTEPEKPAQKKNQKPALSEYIPPSESEEQSGPNFPLPIRKEKPKTKGSAGEPRTVNDEPSIPHESTSNAKPRITLAKKPYHTFSTLFYQPSPGSQPGEVPWTDFVSAMSAISCLPEKLYGSVWRFTPKDDTLFGTETPINFHEPHPVPKLPFRTARMYGRRLTRHYGIDGGCFALGY